jgi:thiol-disulfide isomerase/thioredoxin
MFSASNSNTLGKSDCSKCKSYIPSATNSMNISFKPMKNPSGNVNFVAIVEEDDENIEIPKDRQVDEEVDTLYDNKNIYSPTNNELVYEDDKKRDIFSLDNDYIKTFYVGSITVVGLYILFRILNKTK